MWATKEEDFEECLKGQKVDEAWRVLEEVLVSCRGLRSPGFKTPEARVLVKPEEPPQQARACDTATHEARGAQLRKRLLNQMLIWHDKENPVCGANQERSGKGPRPGVGSGSHASS